MASETRAKQRDHKRVLDACKKAYACFGQDDFAGARDYVEHALGLVDIADAEDGPKLDLTQWDKAFARLCQQFGVIASFVILENAGDEYAGVRVGGAADLAGLMSDALEGLETKMNSGRTASGLYVPGATGGAIKR